MTGIEGTYRSTCESVMTVLRNNKDSLLAVLEAFVYDPLLNWRLIETGPKQKKSKGNQPNGGLATAGGGAATANGTNESTMSNMSADLESLPEVRFIKFNQIKFNKSTDLHLQPQRL